MLILNIIFNHRPVPVTVSPIDNFSDQVLRCIVIFTKLCNFPNTIEKQGVNPSLAEVFNKHKYLHFVSDARCLPRTDQVTLLLT